MFYSGESASTVPKTCNGLNCRRVQRRIKSMFRKSNQSVFWRWRWENCQRRNYIYLFAFGRRKIKILSTGDSFWMPFSICMLTDKSVKILMQCSVISLSLSEPMLKKKNSNVHRYYNRSQMADIKHAYRIHISLLMPACSLQKDDFCVKCKLF